MKQPLLIIVFAVLMLAGCRTTERVEYRETAYPPTTVIEPEPDFVIINGQRVHRHTEFRREEVREHEIRH